MAIRARIWTYAAQADIPTGDFGLRRRMPLSYACVEMASAAHVYGKPIVRLRVIHGDGLGKSGLGHPFAIKAYGDWVFLPWDKPDDFASVCRCSRDKSRSDAGKWVSGRWGQHSKGLRPWWEQSKAWIEYLRRCQYLLQQGLFVADILLSRAGKLAATMAERRVERRKRPGLILMLVQPMRC